MKVYLKLVSSFIICTRVFFKTPFRLLRTSAIRYILLLLAFILRKRVSAILKDAFTLFEVLLALGLLVFAVSMIAKLEFGSLTRVLRDRDEIEKIFLIKKELYTHFFSLPKRDKKIVTKLESPEITITTQFVDIAPKSSLARLKDNVQLIQTKGQWKIGKDEHDTTMIAFAFKPKKEKEKEKK